MTIIFRSHSERRDWDMLKKEDRELWGVIATEYFEKNPEEFSKKEIYFYDLLNKHRKENNLNREVNEIDGTPQKNNEKH